MIRIILADDHKIVRQGLRELLDKQQDVEIAGEAEDGHSLVELAKQVKPDVAIIDIGMPLLNGIEATRKIHAEVPGCKILALSMHSDKRFVIETLKAGAAGYLLKESAFDELLMALHEVLENRSYLSPKLVNVIVGDYSRREYDPKSNTFSVLSPREREVLQLIAEGKSTKEVASVLGVSPKTVETHRQQIMNKLNIRSVAELTKYAIREGLTGLEH